MRKNETDQLAGGLGFEPRLTESESPTLPLRSKASPQNGLSACGSGSIGYGQNVKRPSPKRSRVYFIQCGCSVGYIKIGVARDPHKRLATLQTASPYKLTLLHDIVGGAKEEGEMHVRFAHLHHHGEWFRPGADLLLFAGIKAKKRAKPNEARAKVPRSPIKHLTAEEQRAMWMEVAAEGCRLNGQPVPEHLQPYLVQSAGAQ